MTSFYEQIYSKNGREFVFGLPEQKLIDFLKSHHFPQKYACDLGCGDGRQAIYLASNGWKVLTVDNSQNALNKLDVEGKRFGLDKNIDLLFTDIGVLELQEDTFALALCVRTIHEIGARATKHLLQEAKKSVKEHGIIYLAFFIPYEGTYMKKGCYYPFEADITKEFTGWEMMAQYRELSEHSHIMLDSDGQTEVHKHMLAHLFFRKRASPLK